jgi:hypothetical protein
MPMYLPKDGDYSHWETELAARYPLALSEMRWPSHPRNTIEATALARWGLECRTGWRQILVRLLDKLEAAIGAQPADLRDHFRIVQLKEKFGRLTVYQDQLGTAEMRAAIEEAGEASVVTCETCGEPGRLAERNVFWSVKCAAHENWSRFDRLL